MKIPGRGASSNPANRFERLTVILGEGDEVHPRTEFFADNSRTVLTRNESPDVGFDVSLNPYRGCEHGCVYCYARPSHEYLGFSSGLDFETQILVKRDAPRLLRGELASEAWTPQVIALSGVTDPYQPLERKLGLTRSCLEVLAEFRNPVSIVTKNHLVTRDLDILTELAEFDAVQVRLSVTTLDGGLRRVLEPRTSAPDRRLAAIAELARRGVPVGVMVAPVIPGLTEHEIPRILRAAGEAGARTAGYQLLRLPHAVKDLFREWLELHLPERANRILRRIEEVRGGRLNDSRFRYRMSGEGTYARQIGELFDKSRRRLGLSGERSSLSTTAFRRTSQLRLPLS
jgi:DNA repair photolyase